MQKTSNLITLFFSIILLFSSCATIFSGTTSRLNIRTEPRNADITVTDKKGREIFNGKGPAEIRVKNGAGYFGPAKYQVLISAPGYTTYETTITFKLNAWYFGNLAIGGLLGMLVIDPISGGMWKINDPVVFARLDPQVAAETPVLKIHTIDSIPEELREKMVRIQ